jgi:hypothetical protein
MLEPRWIRSFYLNGGLKVPELWMLSRKHFRVETAGGRFFKLNRFRCRLNLEKLKELCATYSPLHVYFSVLDWLFPERVSKKFKAKYALGLNFHLKRVSLKGNSGTSARIMASMLKPLSCLRTCQTNSCSITINEFERASPNKLRASWKLVSME